MTHLPNSEEGASVSEEAERKAFEEAAFAQYFFSGIRSTNDPISNALQIHFVPASGQKTKDEFLTRYPSDGAYVEPSLNAAWWAWIKRAADASRIIADLKAENEKLRAVEAAARELSPQYSHYLAPNTRVVSSFQAAALQLALDALTAFRSKSAAGRTTE